MNYTQSNTKRGPFTVATATDLTGKEGYLVKMTDASNVLTAALPAAATDVAMYLVVNVISSTLAEVQPLCSEVEARIVAGCTTLVSGDFVIAYGGTAAGQAFEWASGAAFIVGIAEETAGTAGQYVRVRPILAFRQSTFSAEYDPDARLNRDAQGDLNPDQRLNRDEKGSIVRDEQRNAIANAAAQKNQV